MFPEIIFSQETYYLKEDKAIFDKYVRYISSETSSSIDNILEKTSLFFLGVPYIANTLEGLEKETLVINLREMDCVTFVENVLALSIITSENNLSFESFCNALKSIRYRDSKVDDYSSRIHYTSDWIFENQRNGILKNISQDLSGVLETKEINFMSSHPNSYRQLSRSTDLLKKIISIENMINEREGFFYLPKNKINAKSNKIPHMSIIAFTTSIKGLDTSHLGFAFKKQNGEFSFIHASSSKKEVILDNQTISNYCLSQKSCTGIIVAQKI